MQRNKLVVPETSDIYLSREQLEQNRLILPSGLYTVNYRWVLLERVLRGMYEEYIHLSNSKRNWNADTVTQWSAVKKIDFESDDKTKSREGMLSQQVGHILDGFYAVEQYAPEYVLNILKLVSSRARRYFTLRWGAEEEKHSDAWRNAVLATGFRSQKSLEEYTYNMNKGEFQVDPDDPIKVLVYVVFQELATKVNYDNFYQMLMGKLHNNPNKQEVDEVLAKVAKTISIDEAAHYGFFRDSLSVVMYYFPQETIEAMISVLEGFRMPAQDYIPKQDYSTFSEEVYKAGVYGPRQFSRDVVQKVFDYYGIQGKRQIVEGIKRTRIVPDEEGNPRETAIFSVFDPFGLERKVEGIVQGVKNYQKKVGIDSIRDLRHIPNEIWPKKQ